MAQSSSYKQFARGTRILTEESGFAGGMMWTENNIDATHLKTIVNCDYDETTGYLKTRNPFVAIGEKTAAVDPVLQSYNLIGTYQICPFDSEANTLSSGTLYVFVNETVQTQGVWNVAFNSETVLCLFDHNGSIKQCALNVEDVVLKNLTQRHMLLNYDNYLYGVSSSDSGIQIYCVVCSDNAGSTTYTFEQKSYIDYVLPKINSITLLEAVSSGFNAAKGADIFTYQGEEVDTSSSLNILGAYCMDTSNNVVVSPRVGQNTKVRLLTTYHKGKPTYAAMFQLNEDISSTELDAQWSCVDTVHSSSNGTFEFDFTFSKKNTTLGFVYYGETNPGETPAVYSDSAVDYLKPYTIVANNPNSNLKAKAYDFTSLDGSCIWKNRLCVWSTSSNNNCLFLSEVDNFFYYPVPHNVAVFDANVINCIPYKDTLLVFTANKIYRLSENNDGSFSQTVLQNDMPLSIQDAAYLTAIKNMVLFKSGNYFYMVVPKSQSLTDELSIAPIYKNIAGFLNTLDKSTREVIQLMYPEYMFTSPVSIKQSALTAYAEQDTLHILYDVDTHISEKTEEGFITPKGCSFKMFLNYNTNLRAWTLYVEETTQASLDVAALTTAQTMSFVRIHNTTQTTTREDGVEELTTKLEIVTQQKIDDMAHAAYPFRLLLDTGYRTLSSAVQKRFREIQLKLHCASENVTSFGTAFLVDGVWRRNYSKLEETVIAVKDQTSSEYINHVSLTPVLDLNTFITELSMPVDNTGTVVKNPGSDSIELDDWTLDFSHFKREAPVTVRIPVSGKGYNPRFIFMAPTALNITINEVNWVYRLMNGR